MRDAPRPVRFIWPRQKNRSMSCGGSPLQWNKMGGIIKTDNFRYDVHWFELNGEHYEEKLKEVRKNEG